MQKPKSSCFQCSAMQNQTDSKYGMTTSPEGGNLSPRKINAPGGDRQTWVDNFVFRKHWGETPKSWSQAENALREGAICFLWVRRTCSVATYFHVVLDRSSRPTEHFHHGRTLPTYGFIAPAALRCCRHVAVAPDGSGRTCLIVMQRKCFTFDL